MTTLKLQIPLGCALALLALCGSTSAQSKDPFDMSPEEIFEFKRSQATETEYTYRENQIRAELASGAVPEWAGEYYFGDGLGVNVELLLAPQGGFVFTWSGCLGIYDRNYGQVLGGTKQLALEFTLPNYNQVLADVLVPLRWGPRHFLIGESRFRDFINAVNAGLCDEHCPRFLLKRGDEALKPEGRPDLDTSYSSLLRDAPIFGRVTQILQADGIPADGEYRERTALVELDIGYAEGLWDGMDLYATGDAGWRETYTVVELDADHHKARARLNGMSDVPLQPEVGQCLSTRVDAEPAEDCTSPPYPGAEDRH